MHLWKKETNLSFPNHWYHKRGTMQQSQTTTLLGQHHILFSPSLKVLTVNDISAGYEVKCNPDAEWQWTEHQCHAEGKGGKGVCIGASSVLKAKRPLRKSCFQLSPWSIISFEMVGKILYFEQKLGQSSPLTTGPKYQRVSVEFPFLSLGLSCKFVSFNSLESSLCCKNQTRLLCLKTCHAGTDDKADGDEDLSVGTTCFSAGRALKERAYHEFPAITNGSFHDIFPPRRWICHSLFSMGHEFSKVVFMKTLNL